MRTYWRAELYRHDALVVSDFPERDTAAEALADADDRYGSLTETEQNGITGGANEWEVDGDGAGANTGNCVDLDIE